MSIKRFFDVLGTVLIMSWVLLQFISLGVETPTTNSEELPKKIENTWKDLKKRNLVAGSILIKKGSTIVYEDGPSIQTYPISSVSKSFVGLHYLKLQQDGLDLQTPVCHWLENFCSGEFKKITLQMLLDHKSGFGRDLTFLYFLKRSFTSDWSITDIDQISLKNTYLHNPPGKKFSYSNFGYLTLSRILEKIEKKSFQEIVSELASSSQLYGTHAIIKGDTFSTFLLLPWSSWNSQFQLKTFLYKSAGTGGLKSSTFDLVNWLEKIDFQKLSETFSKTKDRYSNGWVRSIDQPYEAFWHNGASLGSYSLVATIPESDLKIVILTNNWKLSKQWTNEAEQFEKYFY